MNPEDADLNVYRLAGEWADRFPSLSAEEVAHKVVQSLTTTEQSSLLTALLVGPIESHRRYRVRQAERNAGEAASRKAYEEDPRFWHKGSQRYKEWAKTTREGRAFHAGFLRDREEQLAERQAKREWRESPEGQREIQARTTVKAATEYKRQLYESNPAEYDRQYGWGAFVRSVNQMVSDIRTTARLELTAELLGSQFALGDGSQVSWGDATIDQHRQRIEFLMKHVDGNLQTIRLHEVAASMLRESHASCLNEVAVPAA